MYKPAKSSTWDIFCNVIDNFGDIGVCWRLARQLIGEHGLSVRLWVDDLQAFQRICPEITLDLPIQTVHGLEVRYWSTQLPDVVPGEVVIEAFACHLPDAFSEAMAACDPKPVWINLDYLSAEKWVEDCHALPSPHPRLPLVKHFFFPGFNDKTGGLLRERTLDQNRRAFSASPELQNEFWQTLGFKPCAPNALKVSLFAYASPAIPDLLKVWASGEEPVCCLAPITNTLPALEAFSGQSLQAGDVVQRGRLEIRVLPIVAQADYDRFLWLCDINFVRGEDSFVRAQWAAKPLVWHIYPQEEEAHRVKLEAFLDRYCAGLDETSAQVVRQFHWAWNEGRITPALWVRWMRVLPELGRHAGNWAKNLKKQEDLCSTLVRFCRSKL